MAPLTKALLIVALAGPVLAYESYEPYRDGRVRYLEAGAVLQRATESAAEEAVRNMPFLPGDRVWTDDWGRIEFQFADGTLLRLDRRSKLDYIAQEGDRVVLRVWSGAVQVRSLDAQGNGHLEIETPAGVVLVDEPGAYRVDVVGAETRLSVYDGEARIEGPEGRARVGPGERCYAVRGEAPEAPHPFDRSDEDSFSAWNQDRDAEDVWASGRREYLPEEVAPYAVDLESHGTWYFDVSVGHVWRPRVGPGWYPYREGRWIWTAFGWTWLPYEPWGWAPFHYGRWGFSDPLGWYWVPGPRWGPAWVAWSVGPRHVGWCPLGRQDRPIVLPHYRGRAVPRGSAAAPWTYVEHAHLRSQGLSRRFVAADQVPSSGLRTLDLPGQRLDHDLRVTDRPVARSRDGAVSRGLPRSGTVNHSPGDTVPELRRDPFTTIPIPRARAPRDGLHLTTGERATPSGDAPARAGARSAPAARPTDGRHQATRPTDRHSAPDSSVESGSRVRPGASEQDVLRRFFGPLTGRSEGGRSRSPEAVPRSDTRGPSVAGPRSRSADPERTSPREPRRSVPATTPPERKPGSSHLRSDGWRELRRYQSGSRTVSEPRPAERAPHTTSGWRSSEPRLRSVPSRLAPPSHPRSAPAQDHPRASSPPRVRRVEPRSQSQSAPRPKAAATRPSDKQRH